MKFNHIQKNNLPKVFFLINREKVLIIEFRDEGSLGINFFGLQAGRGKRLLLHALAPVKCLYCPHDNMTGFWTQ